MSLTIVPFDTLSAPQREEAAAILLAALAHFPSAWRDLPSARAETETFSGAPDRVAFAALDGNQVIGWIGAIRDTPVLWELHPLVVAPDRQRQGIGTRLLARLEAAARDAGALTLWLATDDDFGGTNLYGVDLYPDVLAHLARLAPTAGHPFTFYCARGFSVTGVLPDATGPGRPDIVMAKRVGGRK
jgi:aminoglycoside 6'-N-acetyltransferase I